MTMLDNRNSPQPGSSDFGNWQRSANIGLFGMNPVISFAGLILILGAGGMMMFLGPLPALVYLAIAAVFYVPLAVKIEGKSVFARLVRRGSFPPRPPSTGDGLLERAAVAPAPGPVPVARPARGESPLQRARRLRRGVRVPAASRSPTPTQ